MKSLPLLSQVLLTCFFQTMHVTSSSENLHAATQPNVIIIFADDLGYGDLGCFGHPTIRTPELDRMAREGMKLTQFYSAAPVCTPSRAALMTGRLPARNGMCSNKRRVLFPTSKGGLPASEITLAERLQDQGYATACIGKWHLGHRDQYLPTQHGFDSYFGIPYSNDMDRNPDSPKGRAAFLKPLFQYWNVPLMRDHNIVEQPADQRTITKRYTEEAINFIHSNSSQPFFLYLPHSLPHVPLFRSSSFVNRSPRGLYGDVIEEIDWSVGQILETLRQTGISEKTLVFFTSDNGPWLIFNEQGGSAGLLRGGKGSTWEGGMREPTLAWWPKTIPPNSVATDICSTMDIYATVHHAADISLPQDRILDSYDMMPILTGRGASMRKLLFYYRGYNLMAVRKGQWKMHLMTQESYGQPDPVKHDPPLLFNLDHDPSEKYNLGESRSEIIATIMQSVAAHKATLHLAASELEK